MTVCIAGICPNVQKIVLVCDALGSHEWTSIEGIRKFESIDDDAPWLAMFAGDVRRFAPLMEAIRKNLSGPSTNDVIEACENAYRSELKKVVETELLLNVGKTRDEFIEHGREWFGDSRFGAILDQILGATLGIELLVAGFDEDGDGQIFELSDAGAITRQVQPLFHAVGAGKYTALGSLYPIYGVTVGYDLNEIVYRLCAAKFAAESTPSVGKDTTVLIVSTNGVIEFLFSSVVDKLRELWKDDAQRRIPIGVNGVLDQQLQALPANLKRIVKDAE